MGKLNVETPLHRAVNQGIIDSGMDSTGSEVNVFVGKKKPKFNKNEEFIQLFKNKSAEVLKDMKAATVKVYSWFLCSANYGNFVECRIGDIVEWVGISKKSVIKALKELEEKQIIIKYKNPNDTRMNFYNINPHMAWKGSVNDRNKTIKHMKSSNQLTLPLWKNEPMSYEHTSPKPTEAIRQASEVIRELNNKTFKTA